MTWIRSTRAGFFLVLLNVLACMPRAAGAQQGQQPPPFTVPAPPMPSVGNSPGQQTVPMQQRPQAPLNAPQGQPYSYIRQLQPMSVEPPSPSQLSQQIQHTAESSTRPQAEAPTALHTNIFSLVGPYLAPRVPQLPATSTSLLDNLVRDGKLYLSLHDAIVLAIENNLDVEVSRYDLLIADTDLTRAEGGGNLRGIDYTVEQTPPGVGAATSPILITATTGNTASTNTSIVDLSQVTQTGSSTQQNLSQNGTFTFSPGPSVPLYDPTITGQAAYLRRSNLVSLLNTGTSSGGTGGGSGSGTSAQAAPLDFVSTGIAYQQGFSSGAQLEAYVDNSSQVLYASGSQFNPFHSPSTSVTLTQPLLRGRGRGVNVRFIRIAKLDRKISRLVFEQQMLETIYGVSRLYYDLVSLGENIQVKEESLAAAERLYDDDKNQVNQGTLAPVELMRAQALLSSSRLDLIQAQGEYRQQETILREQLLRKLGGTAADFISIVATDHIVVPDAPPALDVPALIQDALLNRPDLAQAGLQVKADQIYAGASRNNVRPALNVYANVQTRGSTLAPYEELGSPGTGIITPPPNLTEGGLDLSTIYQGGIQLNLPLRNRIAQADAARDAIQMRQAQSRTDKLENDVRQQVENAAIALETAHQAYAASVESSNYQQQLLQAEKDKFTVGASTNFMIVQDQAYLAQARSTEVAARSDWMKARISLDRALGNLLEKNNIVLADVIRDQMR